MDGYEDLNKNSRSDIIDELKKLRTLEQIKIDIAKHNISFIDRYIEYLERMESCISKKTAQEVGSIDIKNKNVYMEDNRNEDNAHR